MSPLHHIAIYITAEENAVQLSEVIMAGKGFRFAEGLEQKRGALFSLQAIRNFVKEEQLHDRLQITTAHGSMATSSSGEQRKALLYHLLAQQPDYLLADNLFESLDTAGQSEIEQLLRDIAPSTQIIQFVYRKRDCLSFITEVLTLQNSAIIRQQTRAEFLKNQEQTIVLTGQVPPPLLQDDSFTGDPLVKLVNLHVVFNGRPVLNDICWEIKRGEYWQLVGPNGSGKTTLLSIITGDSVKGYGQEVYLFGRKKGSGETVWDIKRHIGYFTAATSQEFPRQDTIEQMIIGGFFDSVGLYHQPSDQQVQLAGQWLSLLGMYEKRHQPFRSFTLVQQRMILIARAMVKHPLLLILDEPTTGLDDDNAQLFAVLINKLARETQTAILYVSHRKEKEVMPGKIFQLVPAPTGSTGVLQKT